MYDVFTCQRRYAKQLLFKSETTRYCYPYLFLSAFASILLMGNVYWNQFRRSEVCSCCEKSNLEYHPFVFHKNRIRLYSAKRSCFYHVFALFSCRYLFGYSSDCK